MGVGARLSVGLLLRYRCLAAKLFDFDSVVYLKHWRIKWGGVELFQFDSNNLLYKARLRPLWITCLASTQEDLSSDPQCSGSFTAPTAR